MQDDTTLMAESKEEVKSLLIRVKEESEKTVQKHQFFGTQPSLVHISHPYMTTGKTIALTIWNFVGKLFAFYYALYICHSFYSKEQVSFNFMASVIICSGFGAQENKICHCFHFFPFYFS